MNGIVGILGMHGVLIQLLTTEDQGQSHCNTELNNIKQYSAINKFALLWCEAQLCLPYVCLKSILIE